MINREFNVTLAGNLVARSHLYEQAVKEVMPRVFLSSWNNPIVCDGSHAEFTRCIPQQYPGIG